MAKKSVSEYTVALNLRGRTRQFGVKSVNNLKSSGKQSFMIILVTLVLFALFTVINSSYASTDNLLAMVKSLVPYAILGLGVTFVIATGGIDLSIGTVLIASSVMAGTICRTTTSVTAALAVTIPLMVIFGLLFGILNGFLIAKLKLPPFIATLGTMMLSRGVSAVLANIVNKTIRKTRKHIGAYLWEIQLVPLMLLRVQLHDPACHPPNPTVLKQCIDGVHVVE